MKKGITPVVAIILLLMITIAVIGFAFGFFQTLLSSSGAASETQLQDTTNMLGKSVRIDGISSTGIVVRHSGSVAIAAADLTVLVNGQPDSACVLGAMAVSSVATCNFGSACSTGDVITVSSPAGPVYATCP